MKTSSTSIKQWQDRKKCIENLGLHNRNGARGAGGAGLPLLSHRFATKRNTKASRPLLGRGLSSTYLFRRSHGRYKIFWQSLSKGMRPSCQKFGKLVFVKIFFAFVNELPIRQTTQRLLIQFKLVRLKLIEYKYIKFKVFKFKQIKYKLIEFIKGTKVSSKC